MKKGESKKGTGAGVVAAAVVGAQVPCVNVGLSAESSSMLVGFTSTQKVLKLCTNVALKKI